MVIINYPLAGGKVYKIVYDTDGGQPLIPNGKKKKGGAATPYYISHVIPVKITEETISGKTIQREHEFVRWYGDDGNFYYPNDQYIVDNNLSLLAKYIKIYKITYDVNGSSTKIEPNPDKKYENLSYTITDTVPVAPGQSETYTFLNWLGSDSVKYPRSGTYLTNADLTLTAQYGNPSPLVNFTYSGTWFYTGWKEANIYSQRMPNLGTNYNASDVQNRIKNYNDLCIALVTNGELKFYIDGYIDAFLVGGGGSGGAAKCKENSTSGIKASPGNSGTSSSIFGITAAGGGGGGADQANSTGTGISVKATGGDGGLSGGSSSASIGSLSASRPTYTTEQINAVKAFGEANGLIMSGGGGGGAAYRKSKASDKLGNPGKWTSYYTYSDETYQYVGYNPTDAGTTNGTRNASSGFGYAQNGNTSTITLLPGLDKFGGGGGGMSFLGLSSSASRHWVVAAAGGGGGNVNNITKKAIIPNEVYPVTVGVGGAAVSAVDTGSTSGKGGNGVVLIRVSTAITWYTYAFSYGDWEKYSITEYDSVDDCLNAEYGSTEPSTPSSLKLYWEEDITFNPSAATAEFTAIGTLRDNINGITSTKLNAKLKKFSEEKNESCCWIKNGQSGGDNIYFDGWWNLFQGKEVVRIDKYGLRNEIIPDKSSEQTVQASPYAHYDGEIYNGRVWYSYSLNS